MKFTSMTVIAALLLEILMPGLSVEAGGLSIQDIVVKNTGKTGTSGDDSTAEIVNGAIRQFQVCNVVAMSRGEVDFSELTKGWYAHVAYTIDGVRRSIVGKIFARRSDRVVIQSVSLPWREWRIADNEIDMLVSYETPRDTETWLKTRRNLIELHESVVSVMDRRNIDVEAVSKGQYAYVVYATGGERRRTTGKIVKKETDGMVIQSVPLPLKRHTEKFGDIDTLVVSKQPNEMEAWFRGKHPKVRLRAPSISKRWITGRFVGSTSDTLEILSDRGIQRFPVSSIDRFAVHTTRSGNAKTGLKIGAVLGVGLLSAAWGMAQQPSTGRYEDLPIMRMAVFASLSIMLGSALIGSCIKSDRWTEMSPDRLNLGIAPTQNKGLRAALSFRF